ncbi:MAG: ABC transporter ATP-binding protein [Deltaproteobacteria bacterium]|nr:ABC transporter ATP-binding protein [Deltaproteobacteria bacterium]
MATVTLEGLTKRFAEAAAVHDLHLEIGDGEFVSLLGPSGCGKTTTLRLIAGFLQPEEGEIRVDQQVVSSRSVLVPPERRNMSMIFQSYAVWPHMTVFQNVAYGLKFRKLAGDDAGTRVERLLQLVHLETLKDRYPAELSGGQQQRVALARALVVQPQILLLDEPLSNLDANLREEMRFEIRRLHEEFRITTIYVTHDQAEAMVTSSAGSGGREGRWTWGKASSCR